MEGRKEKKKKKLGILTAASSKPEFLNDNEAEREGVEKVQRLRRSTATVELNSCRPSPIH